MISQLQRWILQFNLLPSLELHPARIADYAPEPVWQAVGRTHFGHRKLSEQILEAEGLHDDWVMAFETRERRVALLGWQALDRLVLLTGAALNAQWIATRIDGKVVATLKASLGPSSYGFAVGRARFLGIDGRWPGPNGAADPIAWLRQAGECYLRACVERQPTALVKRLALRLPPAASDVPAVAEEQRPDSTRAASLFRKLAPEVGPECALLLG